MEQVGRVLPHPSPEQVRLITVPFPLPAQQVSQGAAWERTDAFTGQPTQRQAYSFLPQRGNKMFVKHFYRLCARLGFLPSTKARVFLLFRIRRPGFGFSP